MKLVSQIVALVIGAVLLGLIVGVLFAFPVMWLWNYAVVGTIAGVAKLTFGKAFALMILCALLFKSSSSSSSK